MPHTPSLSAPASVSSAVPATRETTEDLFVALRRAMPTPSSDGAARRQAYRSLKLVFHRVLDLMTAEASVTLAGTFAKVDYLLKSHHADRQLMLDVNDMRIRLRRTPALSDDDMAYFCLYDFRTLFRFVAFVGQVAVPADVAALLPADTCRRTERELAGEVWRMVVRRWDDTYVYGTIDGDDPDVEVTVCYARDNHFYDFDWSYLTPLLHQGTQLNLVRPRRDGQVIYPELLIFEPDYLVDISTVARSFTEYAESAMPSLLNRLQPNVPTEATVLGNFASQMLDEQIHNLPVAEGQNAYVQSVKAFFRTNAVPLLTAGVSSGFHAEAQRQQGNIRRAIHHDLKVMHPDCDLHDGMVEPSFYCEMLGIQGRMDYLHYDFRILIEQKSGKGDFPYHDFQKPTARREHYVQLLLYMLLIRYNFRADYERIGRDLHAYLLYSKYVQPMDYRTFSSELAFRALKVRNEIAAAELRYGTEPHAFDFLATLTADAVNLNHVHGKLWTDYQRPQIEAVLSPIRSASPLERAYYLRFLSFVAAEHVLSKLGNRTKESSGFASTWHDTLDEKLAAGNIYCGLSLVSPDAQSQGSVTTLRLAFTAGQEAPEMSNFRVGDIVMCYPYAPGTEPDARRTMVFRATVADLTPDEVTLQLRAAQSEARVFLRYEGQCWAVEHDFMESSYASLYRAMQTFLTAPQARRDLLMLRRRPEVDDTAVLRGDYGVHNDLALRVRQARDLFLIIGPPGTGKTSFGLCTTLCEALLDPQASVLVMAYTNRAVDEVCGKLHERGIDYLRVGSTLGCAPDYRPHLLEEVASEASSLEALRQRLLSCRVVVGTTTALQSNLALFSLRQFSLAIVDEASQILEPHLLGILSATHQGRLAVQKLVLIGDHKQLPAVVQQSPRTSRVEDPLLREAGLVDCRLSLFERLLSRYESDPSVTYMLTAQGRMHPDIAWFPNQAFYHRQLHAVPLPHQQQTLSHEVADSHAVRRMLRTRRAAFVAVEAPSQSPSDKVNLPEAQVIAATVGQIYALEQPSFDPQFTVGIIVPYRNQIAAVRNAIDRLGIPPLHHITIDTVERFQGSQRKYVIYGFTVQHVYQLSFLTDSVFRDALGAVIDRKLNVAMTRAMEHLVMVGNAQLLGRNALFASLIEAMRQQGAFVQPSVDDYLSGAFALPAVGASPSGL